MIVLSTYPETKFSRIAEARRKAAVRRPGNVRELKNSIERAVILRDEPLLRPLYLPFSVAQSGGLTAFER